MAQRPSSTDLRRGWVRGWQARALSTVAACLSPSLARGAEPPVRVTVLAQARFDELSNTGGPERMEIHARLLDDAGQALVDAEIAVRSRGATRGLALSPCDTVGSRSTGRRDPLVKLSTDAEGKLCVGVVMTSPKGIVELTFPGDALHLPAHAEIPLQPARSELRLAFEAPSIELDLERPTQRLQLQVSGSAPGEPFPELGLALHDAGRELELTGTDWVRSGDTLAFSLASERLGAAGPARLVARYPGSDRLASAQAEVVALRVVTVRLEAEIVALDETGAELHVTANTSVGVPSSGWLEASVGDEPVGSTPFVAGVADLALPTSTLPSSMLTLRYRADDPWWLPGEPLELRLERLAPSAPARWPWLVLLAPIGYVCLRSLQRPALRKAGRRRPPPRKAAALTVESRPSASGWSGTVSDAHEGVPIAGARVEALLPSLRATAAGLIAISDTTGRFHLAAHPHPLPEGARLRISAPLHTEVVRALPPQGRVDVALMSRRRVLLRRLVRWARSVGPPWAKSREPTPAEIADVAVRRGDARTAQWAEGVEAAAFGGAEVDQLLEETLRAQEPPWQHGGQQSEEQDDE